MMGAMTSTDAMRDADLWRLVHDERQALIDDLALVPAADWERPSLAAGWTVHDVAAHLVDNALTTPWRLIRAMAGARFDFDRQNANGIAAARGASPAQTLDRLRAVADRTSGPPTRLAPLPSRLVEEVAHGEDIRGALGLQRDYPVEALIPAIRYLARTPQSVGGGRELAGRVTLVATDADLRVGVGPELRGPAVALLLWLSGRSHRADELSGPGLDAIG